MGFAFDNSYARLEGPFHASATPTRVKAPRVVKVNRSLAELLGLDADELATPAGAQILAGNVVPEGAASIALAYAGHQFGSFVPQLGDGRAILLGEIVGRDGVRRDVQLKGAGRTPFSRGGDGRAALGPVLREYVVSEAMAALGIPTTRALAAVTTGEPVAREELLPGAVLTRVAASHLRVGTFEYLAARDDLEALTTLTRYALARHYPAGGGAEGRGESSEGGASSGAPSEALRLLEGVIEAQASLVARWMGVGFVHGVMNTDNTSISGETIDYGPCAFLDEYDPRKKFSSIDRGGRYAFANQPRIAQWNLVKLAEALLPLIAPDEDEAVRLATARLNAFPALFEAAHGKVLHAKLGLDLAADGGGSGNGVEDRAVADRALVEALLELLATGGTDGGVDFTLFFRRLCEAAAAPDGAADGPLASMFGNPGAFHAWAERWRHRLARDGRPAADRARAMRLVNPAFIPRNHRIESMIQAAVNGDFAPFETLVRVLAHPYEEQADATELAEPPRVEERVRHTFCGT